MKGWTIHTLKEHYDVLLLERLRALKIEFDAAKEAYTLAEINAEKWRSNTNEWRSAMSDKDNLLLSKAEFISYKESTEKALVMAKERADIIEGKGAGINQFIGWVVALIAIAGFLFTWVIKK